MGHVFDRSLAVLGGIADVLRVWPFNQWELVAQGFNNVLGFIQAERGLRNVCNTRGIGNFQLFYFFHTAHDLGDFRGFAQSSDDFIMVTVAPDRGIGLSPGAAEVMTKPVDRGELTALLRQLLSRDGPILVVEDDLATRETVRHTVEKLGLTVAEVTNGRLALNWLAANPAPALILLDLMMPEMDGFEFLDTFNRRSDWRHVPVVVITAKHLTEAERALLAGRARVVIKKGASIDTDIAEAIRNAVGQRARDPRATAKT